MTHRFIHRVRPVAAAALPASATVLATCWTAWRGEGLRGHRHHLPLLLLCCAPVSALGVHFHSLDHSGLCVGRHYGSHCLSVVSTDGDYIGSGLPPVSPTGGDSHSESEGGPLISMWQLCRLGRGLLIWSVSSRRWMRRWSK